MVSTGFLEAFFFLLVASGFSADLRNTSSQSSALSPGGTLAETLSLFLPVLPCSSSHGLQGLLVASGVIRISVLNEFLLLVMNECHAVFQRLHKKDSSALTHQYLWYVDYC